MINCFILADRNERSTKIKNIILKNIKVSSLNKSEIIIVIGGDGFMLQTLKKYNKFKKPFYGINSGNYGFLMNKFSEKINNNILKKARMVSISPLEMSVNLKQIRLKNQLQLMKYQF